MSKDKSFSWLKLVIILVVSAVNIGAIIWYVSEFMNYNAQLKLERFLDSTATASD